MLSNLPLPTERSAQKSKWDSFRFLPILDLNESPGLGSYSRMTAAEGTKRLSELKHTLRNVLLVRSSFSVEIGKLGK